MLMIIRRAKANRPQVLEIGEDYCESTTKPATSFYLIDQKLFLALVTAGILT